MILVLASGMLSVLNYLGYVSMMASYTKRTILLKMTTVSLLLLFVTYISIFFVMVNFIINTGIFICYIILCIMSYKI